MSFFSNCLRKLQTADIGFQVNPGDTGDNGLFVGYDVLLLAKTTGMVHDNSKRYMEICSCNHEHGWLWQQDCE